MKIRHILSLLLITGFHIHARPLAKVRKDALTVGIQTGTPPFGLNETSTDKGIEYELVAAIANRMGINFRIVKLASLNEGTEMLAGDRIDAIVSHVKPTPQLKERFLLSNPYYKTGLGVLTLKSNQTIFTISDLDNKSVAVTPESGAESLLSTYAPKAKMEMVRSVSDALSLLEKGDAEAIVHDSPILLAEQTRNQGLRLLDFSFTEDSYVALFNKSSAPLVAAFNAELQKLRTATAKSPDPLSAICAKYKIPSTLKPICDGCNAPNPAPSAGPTASAPKNSRTTAPARSREEVIESLLKQIKELEGTVLELRK